MVRKRWRGVAPYFYTVWPLLCIIPHLARSSRDAGSRYADLSTDRAENPNLPSVSPFRRMMNDAGRPAEGFTLSWLLSSRGGRVSAGTTRRTNRTAVFSLGLYFYGHQYLYIVAIFLYFLKIAFIYSFMTKSRDKNMYKIIFGSF